MDFVEGGAEGIKEVIDQVLAALREVWGVRLVSGAWAFSQPRCDNFLKVIGVAMASYIQVIDHTVHHMTCLSLINIRPYPPSISLSFLLSLVRPRPGR
jgi:hypothetical protein